MKHIKPEIDWKNLSKRRLFGVGLLPAGIFSLFQPFFVGEWLIGLLGLAPLIAGGWTIFESVRKFEKSALRIGVGIGFLLILLGFLIFFSPQFTLAVTLIVLSLILAGYGFYKIFHTYKKPPRYWFWEILNGILNVLTAFLIWYFIRVDWGVSAIGIIFGGWLLVTGWTLFFTPEKGFHPPDYRPDPAEHPDYLLGLEPNPLVKEIQEDMAASEKEILWQNAFWSLSILTGFFIVHVIRVDASWSWIGLISPFAALVGDVLMALLIAVALIIPVRLVWRKMTRPIERVSWQRMIFLHETGQEKTVYEYLLSLWLKSRLRFTLQMHEVKSSLNYAFWQILRIGLPLTAIFVAVNSIWGFSWYFNTENWASIVWQKATENKIDKWRGRLAEDVERIETAQGTPKEKIFAVEPEGVGDAGDFSFLVIGDTGEGDSSQMILRDQYLKLGERDELKFLVLSSDIIYPDGRMKDYEPNFYLPFKGFTKPIYAIPGNHDWFDANEGFNANFLRREAALTALQSRVKEDFKTDELNYDIDTLDKRFVELTDEAKRLRDYYGVKNGLQRAPFFEMQTADFALIAIDTGILRTIDDNQKQWLEAALTRAQNKFKFVILGHPFYAGGIEQTSTDEGFAKVREILNRHNVNLVMAGDTHDFEFYKEIKPDGKQTFHFVNGGGGAYLSIGTAIDFPANPPTADYAFYPRTDRLQEKLNEQTPLWKLPFWSWADDFKGYPLSAEFLSGVFDFNRSPFFQSFLEVKVERSKNQVRLLLYGANGQLRWSDIQIGGNVKPADKSDEDFVEFIMPLKQ